MKLHDLDPAAAALLADYEMRRVRVETREFSSDAMPPTFGLVDANSGEYAGTFVFTDADAPLYRKLLAAFAADEPAWVILPKRRP